MVVIRKLEVFMIGSIIVEDYAEKMDKKNSHVLFKQMAV
jgi:hypothetical protein